MRNDEVPQVKYWPLADRRDWIDPDTEVHRQQNEEINRLVTQFDNGQGWLSTLVSNTRNAYLAWPDSKFPATQVRALVDGFLAEIAMLRRPTNASEVSSSLVVEEDHG